MNIQRKDHYSSTPIKGAAHPFCMNAGEFLALVVLICVSLLIFTPLAYSRTSQTADANAETEDAAAAFLPLEAPVYEYEYMSSEEIEEAAKEYVELHKPKFIYPLDGEITSAFAYRVDPITLDRKEYHLGIDISAKKDVEIAAYADGVVKKTVTNDKDYGIYVIIDHDGFETLYAHCSELLVSKGEAVSAGQVIAIAGSTGRSTGVHLHFEVRIDGERVDPLMHMKENGVELSAEN